MAGSPGGRSVGRVSVRVLPDTSQLREDLRKALDRIEAAVRLKIKVDLDTAGLRAQVQAAMSELSNNLRADVQVRVSVDTEHISEQIRSAIRDAGDQELRVTINADLDSALARFRLGTLTRPQTVSIIPTIDVPALAGVASALAALSGGRVAGDAIRGIGRSLLSLDRALPSIAAVGLAITNLASVALSSVASISVLGAGILSIGAVGLALPGIFAGFAAGAVVLGLALVDVKTQLGVLAPGFQNLQNAVSSEFWEGARQPIIDLTNTLLPKLQEGMVSVSSALSTQVATFASELQTQLGGGALKGMFDNLASSVTIATGAMGSIASIITDLGAVGASYLPILAQSFVNVTTSIAETIGAAAEDGRLKAWIDSGIDAAQQLGGIFVSVGSILGSINAAAAGAGAGGLYSLNAALGAVAETMKGPVFQGALTEIFTGAGKGVEGLTSALGPLGNLFAALAPTISSVLALAGQTVGDLVGQIANALASPEIAAGLQGLFTGLASGLQAIGPALPAVATALGAVGEVAGTLAATIGPVLGAALSALAPILTTILGAIQPLIPLLGAALVGAIQLIAPILTQLISSILPPLIALIAGLIPALLPLVSAVLPLIAAVLPLVAAVIAVIAPLLLQVVNAVVPLVAALAGALAPVLTDLATAILPVLMGVFTALSPVLAVVAAAVLPLVSVLLDVLIPVIEALMPVITTVFGAVVDIVTAAMQIIQGVIQVVTGVISGDWSMVWDGIKNVVQGAWELIKSIISGAIEIVVAVLAAAWTLISDGATAAWGALKGIISDAWEGIKTYVTTAAATVVAALSVAWTSVKEGAVAAWEGLKTTVVTAIASVVTEALGLKDKIVSALAGAASWLVSSGSAIIDGLVQGIKGAASKVTSAVSGVLQKARDLLPFSPAKKGPFSGKGWTLYSGRSISEALADGISDNERQVRSAALGMVKAAQTTISATPIGVDVSSTISGTGADQAALLRQQNALLALLPDALGSALGSGLREQAGVLRQQSRQGVR